MTYDRAVAVRILADPLDAALARVGDRWSLLVIDALQVGPRRFNELSGDLPGIAPNVLTARLRRLEAEGLVLGRLYQERPPRAAYELTAPGRELAGALRLLAAWGARHSEEAEPPRHELCGTPLEPRWHCPTCDRTLDEEAAGPGLRYL
ncbi:MAG: winged helix-turn-helix transcriptional regulator [Actinomycetota bacterium]